VSLEMGMSLEEYINSSTYLYKGIKEMEKNIRDYGTRPIKTN
jgi:penicillin-binding protein-related factor A (putative recombinase)